MGKFKVKRKNTLERIEGLKKTISQLPKNNSAIPGLKEEIRRLHGQTAPSLRMVCEASKSCGPLHEWLVELRLHFSRIVHGDDCDVCETLESLAELIDGIDGPRLPDDQIYAESDEE